MIALIKFAGQQPRKGNVFKRESNRKKHKAPNHETIEIDIDSRMHNYDFIYATGMFLIAMLLKKSKNVID